MVLHEFICSSFEWSLENVSEPQIKVTDRKAPGLQLHVNNAARLVEECSKDQFVGASVGIEKSLGVIAWRAACTSE